MEARNLVGPLAGVICLALLAGCSSGGDGSGTDDPGTREQPPDNGATHAISMVPVVGGLSHPWAMAFLPDGDILVTERPGRLRLVRDGELLEDPIPGLPEDIHAQGQGGLLDIELHPDFETNRFVYFSYSANTGAGPTARVARAVYQNGALTSPAEVIFEAEPARDGGRHFGSRLAFDKQAEGEIYLYISLGERGDRDQAQDPGSHLGSVVRIYDDGTAPADNPAWTDGLPEVYSIGIRNPQGLTRHPQTGRIWYHEHGPKGGDEVSIVRAGRNYGWPEISHGTNYDGTPVGDGRSSREGMEQPLYHWEPTSVAPSGMTFYTGDRFPNWQGDLFIGALAERALIRLEVDGERITGEERLLKNANMRIRDVEQGPDGYLWILTDHDPGQLIRLEPGR